MATEEEVQRDITFRHRVEHAICTVREWRQDKNHNDLIAQIVAAIPADILRKESDDPPKAADIKRLAEYFRSNIMTWVNVPPCEHCSVNDANSSKGRTNANDSEEKETETPKPDMEYVETVAPQTEEQQEGRASRVEVYACQICQQQTYFPRYQNVRHVFRHGKGRCGEYANLFGFVMARVLGLYHSLPLRYVTDWSDHVWVEVYLKNEDAGGAWRMVDACEGIIDEPGLYEKGWGKQTLQYVVAVEDIHGCLPRVTDVSARYTRKWQDADYQQRRRKTTTSETAGNAILEQINFEQQQEAASDAMLLEDATFWQAIEEADWRAQEETAYLDWCRAQANWPVEGNGDGYNSTASNTASSSSTNMDNTAIGRQSGSLAWKKSRGEAGEGAALEEG